MLRTVLTTVLVVAVHEAAGAEPCNPVIDGTYCATQGVQSRHPGGPARDTLRPIEGLGSDLLNRNQQPATLGGITLRSGASDCISFMRRSSCR